MRIAAQPEAVAGDQPPAARRGQRGGTDLRPGEVHQHPQLRAGVAGGGARGRGHLPPGVGLVAGAVDAHRVHPALDQFAQLGAVATELRRQCHQDAGAALGRAWPEEGGGVGAEAGLGLLELGVDLGLGVAAGERRLDRAQAGGDVPLAAAEGGEAVAPQALLQRRPVDAAERQEVRQVAGRRLERGAAQRRLPALQRRRAGALDLDPRFRQRRAQRGEPGLRHGAASPSPDPPVARLAPA